MTVQTFHRKDRPPLAYEALAGNGPCVVFLGGFASDMSGTKAAYLEERCSVRGQAFLRFDYSGHGRSGGYFEDGSIGLWMNDALEIIDSLTEGPLVLAGSSMGGWIALLAALARPERVRGLVGIAAAPDFTVDMQKELLTPERREQLERNGLFLLENPYGPPYTITKTLLEDGEKHRLLNRKIGLRIPVRLVQGGKDEAVPWMTALRIAGALKGTHADIVLVGDGDHRLARPADLALIDEQIAAVSALVSETATEDSADFTVCGVRLCL